MAFSSNQPSLTNQLPETINLPDIQSGKLFQFAVEKLFRDISNRVNQKESGTYNLYEQVTSQQYYQQTDTTKFRNVYRLTMNFINLNGSNIAASATVSFAHNISNVVQSAGILANCTATDGTIFTVVYPNVWITSTTAFFKNPLAVQLTQCDIIINVLKES